ncbi:MAG: hypothetical protein LBU07_04280 [Coriobacteriales bacterium]|jgi:hypothetical protein|nr:hypothetical protein [Coriobacteriales bacterium]
MNARDAVAAYRSVLDQAYSRGELTSSPAHPTISNYIQNGELLTGHKTKWFPGTSISAFATGYWLTYFRDAAVLMGKTPLTALTDPGFWYIHLVTSDTPTSTALNADGFIYWIAPDGYISGKSCTVVTYRMQRVDGAASWDDFIDTMIASDLYSADAGYEVYHYVI